MTSEELVLPPKRPFAFLREHLSSLQLFESWARGLILGLLALIIAGGILFFTIFQHQIYPGAYVENFHVGGLTPLEAEQLLRQKFPPNTDSLIAVSAADVSIASSAAELGLHPQYKAAVEQAYQLGRQGWWGQRLTQLIKAQIQPHHIQLTSSFEQIAVEQLITHLKQQVDILGSSPSADLRYSGSPGSLTINPGSPGRELDFITATKIVMSQPTASNISNLPVASTAAQLTEEEIALSRERATQLVGKRIILQYAGARVEANDQTLISLLNLPKGYQESKLEELTNAWAQIVNRPAQDAVLKYDAQTKQVSEFQPDRPGLKLDHTATRETIIELLDAISKDAVAAKNTSLSTPLPSQDDYVDELSVTTTKPNITLADTNDLGINEQIGFGDSEYDHSIPNRIHNVALTTERINNTLIAPGEEFSFNQALGEVSAATGFRSAYVIKQGRTELGDGGGVCQVSTTVFRAVLDAGLKITRRLPHSYRVSYYELNAKPGIDATVYSGNIDLRFVNDTNHHILLHGETDSNNLYMTVEIYGTDDGRTTEITNHEVWGWQPAPPPEYYPDPSMILGQQKQVDWAVAGVKAKFTHRVFAANGDLMRENTYYSNYKPWSAKYVVNDHDPRVR